MDARMDMDHVNQSRRNQMKKGPKTNKCLETLQLYLEGKTVNQIARALSIHPNAVRARMRYATEKRLIP
jgi:DNA-binding CsgD family transcriptional regulator